MQSIVTRNCPACGRDSQSNELLPLGNAAWPMRCCSGCGFVYLERVPTYDRLVEEFAWEKTSASESLYKRKRNPLLQRLSRRLKAIRRRVTRRDKLAWLIERYIPAGRVLDIGCAAGGVLSSLPSRFTPCGIEVSKKLAGLAATVVEPRGGLIIQDNALEGIRSLPAAHCSGVIMSAFLEHETQPDKLLQEVRRVLQPGGVVIIKVPNWASWNRKLRQKNWCGIRLPDHVNYFTPAALSRMLSEQGLQAIKFGLLDHLPTSDNMWIVATPA